MDIACLVMNMRISGQQSLNKCYDVLSIHDSFNAYIGQDAVADGRVQTYSHAMRNSLLKSFFADHKSAF